MAKSRVQSPQVLYQPSKGTPLSRWRITWTIPVKDDDFHGPDFTGQMEMEFHSLKDYSDYLQTLRMAEKVGMCTDVTPLQREIVVGEWTVAPW